MAETEITIDLLEEIKDILEYSLENNEYTRILFGKVHGSFEGNDLSDPENTEEVGKDKYATVPLENILHEKLQENARLKAMNGRLLTNTHRKSQKIKELESAMSLQSQLVQNSRAVSSYRDQLGRCNVEIQKLRKQLKLETKRLQNERTRSARLETFTERNLSKLKTTKSVIGSMCKSVEDNEAQRATPTPCPSQGKLYEDRLQRMLQEIELQQEPSIQDETLDLPENLASDSDERCQCV